MILSFAGMTMILVVLHLAPIAAAAAASLIAPIATTLAATTTTTTTNTVMRGNCCVWSCWKC